MKTKVGSAPAVWGVEAAADPRQSPCKRFLDEVAELGPGHLGLIYDSYTLLPATSAYSTPCLDDDAWRRANNGTGNRARTLTTGGGECTAADCSRSSRGNPRTRV